MVFLNSWEGVTKIDNHLSGEHFLEILWMEGRNPILVEDGGNHLIIYRVSTIQRWCRISCMGLESQGKEDTQRVAGVWELV